MFVADDYAARVIANDPVAGPILAEQYRAAGLPVPTLNGSLSTLATASNMSRPYIPGAEYAPTLDELLGPRPNAPSDPTVSPSGAIPTFRSSTTQLDWYRIAWLVAGVLIGWKLLK